MDMVEKVKGFLLEPKKTYVASKEDTLTDAMRYYIIIAVVFSALFAFMSSLASSLFSSMMGSKQFGMMFTPGAEVEEATLLFARSLILGVMGIFLLGCILHIFVYLMGGRRGNKQTIKAVMYAATPGLLFGWSPFIYSIAALWSLVLVILGIRELHEITTARAIMTLVIPIIILFVIAAVVVFMIFQGASDWTPIPTYGHEIIRQ
ncbi:MAG: YIP1 family protein [Candidatus Methanoperedens sp.]|nr:YIP1 family protein [Candidatus Methanoperedens sp.]